MCQIHVQLSPPSLLSLSRSLSISLSVSLSLVSLSLCFCLCVFSLYAFLSVSLSLSLSLVSPSLSLKRAPLQRGLSAVSRSHTIYHTWRPCRCYMQQTCRTQRGAEAFRPILHQKTVTLFECPFSAEILLPLPLPYPPHVPTVLPNVEPIDHPLPGYWS